MSGFRRAFAIALLLVAGCQRASSSGPAPEPGAKAAPAPSASADARAPVPLTAMMAAHQKSQMRDHLLAIQEITEAVAKDDFETVLASAGRIGWSEQQAMMCKHMGAGAPGFAELGERFHHTADGIAEAARRRDRNAVVAAVGATLSTCVGCHAAYREEIVAP